MKVYVYGSWEESKKLQSKISLVLEELGLTDFVAVENTVDEALKTELNISEESALVIEEESIDFKDMIFEGIIPEDEELKSMFISIIGGWSGWGCGSKDESGSCGTGCAC